MTRPLILFAHGAGAPTTHPWMQAWAERLGTLGEVVPFDYPYMRAGRKAPDRFPKLLEAHREALSEARAGHDGPLVLAGKSMGSRIGCHLACEEPVHAVICLGYPLMPPGRPEKIRDQVLVDLGVPVLFVQGSRDTLCPLDALAEVRPRMAARNELHVVDGGNHSLILTKKLAADGGQQASDGRVLETVAGFLLSVLPSEAG
jgi:uncharacterized protein